MNESYRQYPHLFQFRELEHQVESKSAWGSKDILIFFWSLADVLFYWSCWALMQVSSVVRLLFKHTHLLLPSGGKNNPLTEDEKFIKRI